MSSRRVSCYTYQRYLNRGPQEAHPRFLFHSYSDPTYYAVRAEDEVTAIDLALEGRGLEIDSETRDAYISEDQRSDADQHSNPRRHA